MNSDRFRYASGPDGSGWVTNGSNEIVGIVRGLLGSLIKVTDLYLDGTVIGHIPIERERWLVMAKPAKLPEIQGRLLTRSGYQALGFDPFRAMADVVPDDSMLSTALATGPKKTAAEMKSLEDAAGRAQHGGELVAPGSVNDYLGLAYAVFLAAGEDQRKAGYWSALPGNLPPRDFPLCRFAPTGRQMSAVAPRAEVNTTSGIRQPPGQAADPPPLSVRSPTDVTDVSAVLRRAEASAGEIARTATARLQTRITEFGSELERLRLELGTATEKISRLEEEKASMSALAAIKSDVAPLRSRSLNRRRLGRLSIPAALAATVFVAVSSFTAYEVWFGKSVRTLVTRAETARDGASGAEKKAQDAQKAAETARDGASGAEKGTQVEQTRTDGTKQKKLLPRE